MSRASGATWRTRALTGALTGAGSGVVRALATTWRYARVGDAGVRALRASRTPILFAFWHAQLLPLLVLHRGEGAAVLISGHCDGEIVARLAVRLGFTTLRGSSSRAAAGALRAMTRALREGRDVGVTPDGPRGPARHFAPGPLIAAHHTGAPIILIGVAVDRAWRLHSWDRFCVPQPFARVVVAYSEPYHAESATARGAAAAAALFAQRLDAMDNLARATLAADGPA